MRRPPKCSALMVVGFGSTHKPCERTPVGAVCRGNRRVVGGHTLGAECISNLAGPVLSWTLNGPNGLDQVAQYGEHGETSFHDLWDPKPSETVSKPRGSKVAQGRE